jgi:hypothetical protein
VDTQFRGHSHSPLPPSLPRPMVVMSCLSHTHSSSSASANPTHNSLIYDPRSSTNEEDSAERFRLFAEEAGRLVSFERE